MGFILKTVIKILIRVIILLVPVALFISFFSLGQQGIPVWNIGVRNILLTARNYTAPIVIISYFIATLLTIALIDKTRVRSIILLHIPPIFAGVVIIGGIYLTQREQRPLPVFKKKITLGYKVFVEENVFNELKDRSLLLKRFDRGRFTVFLHDRKSNALEVIPEVGPEKSARGALFVDEERRALVISKGEGKGMKTTAIPYEEFRGRPTFAFNLLVRTYTKKIRETRDVLGDYARRLPKRDRYLFYAVLFLSVLMISIPLTFAFNDAGWGFSGFTGALVILAALPFLYWGVFTLVQRSGLRAYVAVGYGYLFPCAILCFLGILVDLLIKMKVTR